MNVGHDLRNINSISAICAAYSFKEHGQDFGQILFFSFWELILIISLTADKT